MELKSWHQSNISVDLIVMMIHHHGWMEIEVNGGLCSTWQLWVQGLKIQGVFVIQLLCFGMGYKQTGIQNRIDQLTIGVRCGM